MPAMILNKYFMQTKEPSFCILFMLSNRLIQMIDVEGSNVVKLIVHFGFVYHHIAVLVFHFEVRLL